MDHTLAGDRYRLESHLGTGGMASVFLAHDRDLDVRRAIKLLNPQMLAIPAIRRRFVSEARAMARLQH
ncbi:MAG TPA: hypothetical protein QGF58_16710 [Myxococcota bacterium]|nr:hypothetical protein [Myxococcota bacterium]